MRFLPRPYNVYSTIMLACFSIAACSVKKETAPLPYTGADPMTTLSQTFTHIPDSVQTSIYWYWISDNMSVDGVVKDLESMKKVGINRVFIGNIWQDAVKPGNVKIFSDEWWKVLHAALKKATELNIEVGIFNSPGWSQSGGPWIKPEQAMRYLSTTEMMVHGPVKLVKLLQKPNPAFQDVKVIAYPVPAEYALSIMSTHPEVVTAPEIKDIKNALDNDGQTGFTIKEGQKFSLSIKSESPYTARSLTILPLSGSLYVSGDIQAEINGEYKTIRQFTVNRNNDALNVGFNPKAAGIISIPATTANNFRINFNRVSDGEIAEIKLSSTPYVEQFAEKTLAKMWQNPFPNWGSYLWAAQPEINDQAYVIDPAKVMDISKYLSPDGTLSWNVPAGNWIIERTGMTPTQVQNGPASPEGTGLEVDKMSSKYVVEHFNAYLGEILKRIPAEDRKTWKVAVQDSYETGGENWTDGFTAQFKDTYGYDPTPYIPVLHGKVVASADRSDRFLWDLRRLIADNIAYKYVGGLREISHKYGLHTWLENYGHWGFPAEFLQYGGQSDEVGGEFWNEDNLGNIENKAASSAAHIYGKNKVSAESFTAGEQTYVRYPALLKKRADRFFTEGINNTLLHVYIEQPDEDKSPGINTNFGTEFNRKNTWFYDMDIFLQYIKRANMMLQQGNYVADAAYFIGEDAPKMTGVQDPKLPQGYSFDYINAEVIKSRVSVKDGRLVLPDGMSYKMLVLPKLTNIRPEVLLKIKELVNQGAVIWGMKPETSPSLQNYPEADQKVKKLADELWGNIDGKTVKVNTFGKGMVISGMDIQESLELIKLAPDCKITPKLAGSNILFTHRTLADAEIYFISNQEDKTVDFSAAFRASGYTPQLWNPVDGSIHDLPQAMQNGALTTIPLKLAPVESVFIVFRKKGMPVANRLVNYPEPYKIVSVTTPWQVNFDSKMRGPVKPVTFKTLTDWSVSTNDSIKYYSGAATYYNKINLPKMKAGETVYLNLGMVKAIAKVKINGINLGGAWTPPYRIDVSKALKAGNNDIEIKVVNTWVNRLIGDSRLPVNERKTWLNYNPYTPAGKLEPSGLTGPVTFEIIK
ncbi:MAG: glycosyl hydrolase [Pedobacter sp.]|uniref:glycosyl hydrolase n=1 Tax=Pedobacter sp. TaxID=1411316 RepID=UPI00339240AB